MTIYIKRNKIETKVENIIKQKFNDKYFDAHILTNNREDENYQQQVEIFKYLFNQKNKDAEIYLWNNVYDYVAYSQENPIKKDDFTKEENDFFEEIIKYRKNFVKKYGERYDNRFNCNKLIKTLRLVLQPYDENLDREYNNYFLKHKDEYEKFYGVEYSKDSVNRSTHPKDGQLYFAILLKQNREFIGSIALSEINSAKCNIEYFIKPEYRKNGYAFEAVGEILKQLFKNKLVRLKETIKYSVYKKIKINKNCVSARVDINNISSTKLLEKLGFKKDGILKYDGEIKGKFYDSAVYTLEK